MEMYRKSGVNLQEAKKLGEILKRTFTSSNLTDFVGSTEINGLRIYNCCDGIGTKIIPLYERKLYKTIAIDLVAANLNDMATKNVEAVGFSDYIAVNCLDSYAVSALIIELNRELESCNCRLLGGETSEMPDLLRDGVIDISGFAIGIGRGQTDDIGCGDLIIGLKSNGIHANGFSLIRKLHKNGQLSDEVFESCLAPSYVYYNSIRKLWNENLIKSGVNITGGGLLDNLSRVIPLDAVKLNMNAIPIQDIFSKLKDIIGDEVFSVFNCGVGFCLIAKSENFEKISQICAQYEPFVLGRVIK